MTEFKPRRGARRVDAPRIGARVGTSAPDLSTLLLLSKGGGRAIRVVVTADGVSTGMGKRYRSPLMKTMPVPSSKKSARSSNGDAEGYFGTGEDGPLSVIGHRVWYPGGDGVPWMPVP